MGLWPSRDQERIRNAAESAKPRQQCFGAHNIRPRSALVVWLITIPVPACMWTFRGARLGWVQPERGDRKRRQNCQTDTHFYNGRSRVGPHSIGCGLIIVTATKPLSKESG